MARYLWKVSFLEVTFRGKFPNYLYVITDEEDIKEVKKLARRHGKDVDYMSIEIESIELIDYHNIHY